MVRGIVILLLIIVATFLIFDMIDRNVVAQEAGNLSQVLENQKLILKKLEAIDKKLNQLKMRIR